MNEGRKPTFWGCHRQWLEKNHQFRKDKNSFEKGKVESSTLPPKLEGIDIWERVCNLPKVSESKIYKLPRFKEEHN